MNKIYCIGGYSNRSLNVNEVYDSTTDSWSTLSPLPIPGVITASEVNGKTVVLTIEPGTLTAVTQVYDPSTDSWEIMSPMPTAATFFGSIVVDNIIYVFGGGHYEAVFTFIPTNAVQIYNLTSNTWRYGAPLPVDMQSPAVAATSGVYAPKRIYVLGGSDFQYLPYNYVYDPITDTWNNATQMPYPRSSFGVAIVDDVLYAIGGNGRTNGVIPVDLTEKYVPISYVGPEIPELPSILFVGILITISSLMAIILTNRRNKRQYKTDMFNHSKSKN
jgi:N-acetylneuraminic acid mutarotase